MRLGRVILAVVTLLVWQPAILLTTILVAAEGFGCRVSEAEVLPCNAWGVDIGGAVHATTMIGWLTLAAMPFMLATGLAWLVLAVVTLRRRRR